MWRYKAHLTFKMSTLLKHKFADSVYQQIMFILVTFLTISPVSTKGENQAP